MTQQPFAQQPYQQPSGQYAGPPPAYKQLRRSRDDRVVAGICAGVGRYLGIDPVAARVLFVVLAIFSGGTALLAYLIAWVLMPEDPADPWAAAQQQATYPPAAAYQPPAYAHTAPTAGAATAPQAATQPAGTPDDRHPTGTGFPEEPPSDETPKDN